jgi:hypothetical protein
LFAVGFCAFPGEPEFFMCTIVPFSDKHEIGVQGENRTKRSISKVFEPLALIRQNSPTLDSVRLKRTVINAEINHKLLDR